jgi:hypothetical protein
MLALNTLHVLYPDLSCFCSHLIQSMPFDAGKVERVHGASLSISRVQLAGRSKRPVSATVKYCPVLSIMRMEMLDKQKSPAGTRCWKGHWCDRWLASRTGGLFSVQNQVSRLATTAFTCFHIGRANGKFDILSHHSGRSATHWLGGLDTCKRG